MHWWGQGTHTYLSQEEVIRFVCYQISPICPGGFSDKIRRKGRNIFEVIKKASVVGLFITDLVYLASVLSITIFFIQYEMRHYLKECV